MNFKLLIMAAALALPATAAQAGEILVTPGTGQRSFGIGAYDPLGQIFTAIDTSLLSFGFQLQTLNSGDFNGPITLTLLSGAGFGGSTIATRTLTPTGIPTATRTPTWVDFDLSGTTLQVGQQYTALLAANNNRYGLVYGPNINLNTGAALGPDAYAGGSLIASSGLTGVCAGGGICDANFRASGITVSAVPEPSTWAMMLVGFGAIGTSMRRRKAKLTTNAAIA